MSNKVSSPTTGRFFTSYDPPPSPSLECKSASLTRQEFVSEADINNIMSKYAAGLAPIPSGDRPPLFGDFSDVGDYQSNMQRLIDAQDRFMQLPSKLRERFDNDPAQLFDFLADEKNREEAIKLGLCVKRNFNVPEPEKAGDGAEQSSAPEAATAT